MSVKKKFQKLNNMEKIIKSNDESNMSSVGSG